MPQSSGPVSRPSAFRRAKGVHPLNAMWRVQPKNTALLVIDMQNDFVPEGHPMEVPMARRRIPEMQKVITGCREAGIR
ncbi:hypothetical protein DIZ27_03690 [Streptomyces sp. NWU339]|nr:hypothetical protein DIZ27_03690 [Streptomyces sp. NWU339]